MPDTVRVAAATEIAKGSAISVEVGGIPLALVHTDDDEFHAVHDECSHATIPLSEGEVDGCTLECWLHGSRFDLRTGEPSGPPAKMPVRTHLVTVVDGVVHVHPGVAAEGAA